jgi:hypothetical protein
MKNFVIARIALVLCLIVVGTVVGCTRPDQNIAGACTLITGAERGFDVAEKNGKVSRANYERAETWIALKKPVCNVTPMPTSVTSTFYAVLLQLPTVLQDAAAGKDVQPAPAQ